MGSTHLCFYSVEIFEALSKIFMDGDSNIEFGPVPICKTVNCGLAPKHENYIIDGTCLSTKINCEMLVAFSLIQT